MNQLVLNHGFLLDLRRGSGDLRVVLECVTDAQSSGLPLRVHPDAVYADVGGGLPLRQWVATGVRDPTIRDVCISVQLILDAGPFLDPELVVPLAEVDPNPADAPFAGLVAAALGEAFLTGLTPSLLSVGDRGSGLTAVTYRHATCTLANVFTRTQLTEGLRALEAAAAEGLIGALETVTQNYPDVGIGTDLRAGILRGGVRMRGERLLRAAQAARECAKLRREGGDWRAAWQTSFSGPLKDESDAVRDSPSLRALRNFRLADGTRRLVFDHADVSKGDRLYVYVPAVGLPEIVAWTPHLPTKRH